MKPTRKPGPHRGKASGQTDGGRKRARTDAGRGQKEDASPPAKDAEGGGERPERIAKILARAGVDSRRNAERLVMEGRVSVNGKVLDTPAVTATLADRIEIDGVPIRGIERTRLWLYYKPAGLVTTNADPEGRPTVFDNLPPELPRVLAVGRLDINTEGLLLLTNDGGLARVLELPSTGWLRRYRVRAHGTVDQAALDRLKDGIAVEGMLYGSIDATLDRVQGSNVWITVGLREGKNREVKKVLAALGLDVNRLIRLSYGPFQLADLKEGEVREIRGRALRDQLGPRLIADAGANFDAPIFQNEAAAPAAKTDAPRAAAEKTDHSRQPKRDGETKGERRRNKRDEGLARLDTKRDDERPKRRPPPRSRAANVWMAPGARPLGPKKARAAEASARRRSADGERPSPKPARPGTTARKAAGEALNDDRRSRSKAPGDGAAKKAGPHGKGSTYGKRSTPAATGKPAGTLNKRKPGDGKPAGRGRKDETVQRPSGKGAPRGADRRR